MDIQNDSVWLNIRFVSDDGEPEAARICEAIKPELTRAEFAQDWRSLTKKSDGTQVRGDLLDPTSIGILIAGGQLAVGELIGWLRRRSERSGTPQHKIEITIDGNRVGIRYDPKATDDAAAAKLAADLIQEVSGGDHGA